MIKGYLPASHRTNLFLPPGNPLRADKTKLHQLR